MKETILIIDDDYLGDREVVYKSVLEPKYNLISVKSASTLFEQIDQTSADFYIVDIVLDKWLLNIKEVLDITNVLDSINKKNSNKPIILVSSQYETLVKNEKLTRLMNEILINKYNVLNFIIWKDFINANSDLNLANNVLSRISFEIEKYRQIENIKRQNTYDVGIIAALEEEIEPFIKKFPENHFLVKKIGNISVKLGILTTIKGREIKIAIAKQERMGMVDGSYLASILKNNFLISHLFMIGVCGGRESEGIKIGDIIIPESSFAYQNGKLTNDGLIIESTNAHRNSSIHQDIDDSTKKFVVDKFKDYMKNLIDSGTSLRVKAPDIIFTPMACGDVVVDKANELDSIAKRLGSRKLCSVDMESYAILRANLIFPDIKVSVIKSVMDLTNNKSNEYKDYAAFLSSELLYYLLYNDKYLI